MNSGTERSLLFVAVFLTAIALLGGAVGGVGADSSEGTGEIEPTQLNLSEAADTTGDGLLNDVDGDGEFDIFDVQELFNSLTTGVVQNNPELFNFNDNENPTEVTIFDVQGLFNTLGAAPAGEVEFADQAPASSAFTDDSQTDPAVVVNVATNFDGAVVVTYEDNGELVIAGLDTFESAALAADDVTIPIANTSGFPGEHTAHVVPDDDLSGDYSPGDTVSSETADAILDNEAATIFDATLNITDQEFEDATTDVVVNTSDLQPETASDYQVIIHENTADLPVLGNSTVVSGGQDSLTVTLNQEINATTDVLAMLHFPDETSEFGMPIPAVENESFGVVTDAATVEILGAEGANLTFNDQATASSTFTDSAPTAPGVVVQDIEQAELVPQNVSDPSEDFVVLFEGSEVDASSIVAFEPLSAANNGTLVFNLTGVDVTPGEHTVEIHAANESGDGPDPTQPRGVAETATVFQGAIEFQNQTAPDAIAEGDRLATLDTADLLDGTANDTAFTVDVHPTDDQGNLVGAEFVGSSDVLTGANENVDVTAERVPDNGEFNEFPLTRNDSYVAMIHLVDDNASVGDPAAPGQYPALRHASENGTVPGGVTDQGRIAFPAGSIINGTVTASGDTVNTDQAAGEPVSGATVTLYNGNSTDPADEVANTTTSQNGAYAFIGLSAGNYTVEPSDEEFVTESALLAVGVTETVTEEFALDYAEAGNLSGEIGLDAVDPDEAVNLTVTVVGTGNSTTVSLAGSENATTYTIPDVDVNVGDGYTVSATSDSGNYTDPADAENVTVDVGATTTGVDFGFTRQTGDLDGTVANDIGSAIEGATVEVFEFGSDGPLVANDTTGASGAYSIPDLPVGDHFVTVSVDGAAAGETNATVLSNQTTSANFTLDAANFTVATDGDLVGVAGETQTATVTVENIGDLPGEQTVELDWGNGTYTNSTSVALDGGAETVTPLSVTTDPNQGLGSYNVTVTSENETNESKSLVSPTRSLNQTEVSPGGTVNVTVSGQLAEEDTVILQDAWSPTANDSEIISTSVSFLFPVTTDRNIQLASGPPVGPGPLEIVYEVYLPDDVEQGTVYEWEPLGSNNESALEVGDDELPVLGDQSFQITNLTSSVKPNSVSSLFDESSHTDTFESLRYRPHDSVSVS